MGGGGGVGLEPPLIKLYKSSVPCHTWHCMMSTPPRMLVDNGSIYNSQAGMEGVAGGSFSPKKQPIIGYFPLLDVVTQNMLYCSLC